MIGVLRWIIWRTCEDAVSRCVKTGNALAHVRGQALSLDDNGLAAGPECLGGLAALRTLSLCANRIETLAPEAHARESLAFITRNAPEAHRGTRGSG